MPSLHQPAPGKPLPLIGNPPDKTAHKRSQGGNPALWAPAPKRPETSSVPFEHHLRIAPNIHAGSTRVVPAPRSAPANGSLPAIRESARLSTRTVPQVSVCAHRETLEAAWIEP